MTSREHRRFPTKGLALFRLSFEDVLFYPTMQTRPLCNSMRNPRFTRKLKRDYLIPGLSNFGSKYAVNEVRLQAAEPYRNGPYANVHYLDNAVPWADFVFNYKSLSTIFECSNLIIRFIASIRCRPSSS
jgi:hypothetical protein